MDDVFDLFREGQLLFGHDLSVFDDVYRDVMVDDSQNVQIQGIDVTFHLQDVLFSHLVAAGIFDDGDGAVQLVKLQMVVDGHAFSGFDMIEHEAFFDFSYI